MPRQDIELLVIRQKQICATGGFWSLNIRKGSSNCFVHSMILLMVIQNNGYKKRRRNGLLDVNAENNYVKG